MTLPLPPLDLHAHIDPGIDAKALEALGAVIFAVTRSHEESQRALSRTDRAAVWGAGVHPGLVRAQQAFDEEEFRALLARTPFVGEVGLDVTSRVDKQLQLATLRSVLSITEQAPRIVSVHSYGATSAVLDVLEQHPNPAVVLHWWRGNAQETDRATALGCFFSVNPAGTRHKSQLQTIPLDRLLTETDHPAGDRDNGRTARPGNVDVVESVLGRIHGLSPSAVRTQVWANFSRLVSGSATKSAMPTLIARILDTGTDQRRP